MWENAKDVRHQIGNWNKRYCDDGTLCDVLDPDNKKDIPVYSIHLLVAAIVEQAAKDHCRRFFHSSLFDIYMPDYDGPALWKQIAENFEENDKWCRKDMKLYSFRDQEEEE